jgi:hypothetical protein
MALHSGSIPIGKFLARNRRLVPGAGNVYKTSDDMFEGFRLGDTLDLAHPRVHAIRLLKNGETTALTANQLVEGATTYIDQVAGGSAANVKAASAGATKITFDAGVAVAKEALEGGVITVLDGAANSRTPQTYTILSNTLADSGNVLTVTLTEPLRRAITTNGTLVQVNSSPYVTQTGSISGHDAQGVPLLEIPAAHYYWAVAKGFVSLKASANATGAAATKELIKVATGQVKARVEATDNDGSRTIGHIVGEAVAETGYERWINVYIDLT